jgi:hypothetical protein
MLGEPEALVIETSKLAELATSQLRPLAKEHRQPVVAGCALHNEVVIVERGKVGRKVSHLAPGFPHEALGQTEVTALAQPGMPRPTHFLGKGSGVMGISLSILLIAVGAILAWAVSYQVAGIDIQGRGHHSCDCWRNRPHRLADLLVQLGRVRQP